VFGKSLAETMSEEECLALIIKRDLIEEDPASLERRGISCMGVCQKKIFTIAIIERASGRKGGERTL